MKTKEIIELESLLNMYAALGPTAYFSNEAQELKARLNELRFQTSSFSHK